DDAGGAGAGDPAGWDILFCHRYRGLCGLDAGPYRAGARICLRAGGAGQLAPALSGLATDALRAEGAARRPHGQFLFRLQAAIISALAALPPPASGAMPAWQSKHTDRPDDAGEVF